MDKYCYNCGSELKEGADVCLNCGVMINKGPIPVVSAINKAGKAKTPLFNLLAGISMMIMIIFYITAIFQSWVSTGDLYFWIGVDQYMAFIFWLIFLGFSLPTLLFSFKEHKQGKIGIGDKYLAIFLVVTALLFTYVILEQYLWQFN